SPSRKGIIVMSVLHLFRQHRLVVSILITALAGAALGAWAPLSVAPDAPADTAKSPDGWTFTAQRDAIRPHSFYDPKGGEAGNGCFVIKTDRRDGLDGCWTKSFPVTGGKHYRFAAVFQAKGVTVPRRSVVAEIHWRDAQGKKVVLDEPPVSGYLRGMT